jgi:hypothetical protein
MFLHILVVLCRPTGVLIEVAEELRGLIIFYLVIGDDKIVLAVRAFDEHGLLPCNIHIPF